MVLVLLKSLGVEKEKRDWFHNSTFQKCWFRRFAQSKENGTWQVKQTKLLKNE